MKRLRILTLFLLFSLNASGAPPSSPPLRIAAEEWPPFEYLEGNTPTGINVEVISRVFSRLGIACDYQFYPFARSLMLAEKGEIEAIPSLSFQPYRENLFYFDDAQRAFETTGQMPEGYLWKAEFVFFLPRRNAASFRFESYSQIKKEKYRVGLIRNYSYNQEFSAADLGTQWYSTAFDALTALDAGEVDLVPMDRTVGLWILHRLGAQDRILCAHPPLFAKPYFLAFIRASNYPGLADLSQAFNRELKKMRASGEYDSIYEFYIKPDYISKIKRPLLFVCEEWAPFEYAEGDHVRGVDAAVVDYIMKRLGIPYRIAIYPWSRAWMLAEKGKADAVLSISYKSSRENVLYYTEDQRPGGVAGTLPTNYLWLSEYVFFVMNKNASKYSFDSLKQLKQDGVRVGKNRDYTYNADFLDAAFEGPEYGSTEEGLRGLVSGEIDLYPMDKSVGQVALQRLGLQDSITWLPTPIFSKPYLSPFCKNSDFPELPRIMTAFYRELRLLRASGEYDRLYHDALQAMERSVPTRK